MTDDIDDHEEQLLAAEYALGLLAPQEAAAFEVLLDEDAEFRAQYARWAEDFAQMTNDIAPIDPPAEVFARIKQSLFGENPRVTSQDDLSTTTPVNMTPEMNEPVQSSEPLADKVQGWLQKLGLLPAIGGGLVAALLVLWLVNISGVMAPPVPSAAVMLASADDSLIVNIAYTDEGETLNVTRTAGAIPDGQSLELWLIKDDAAPVSLGLLPVDETGTLQVAEALRPLLRGAQCAISVEPEGGSPTGAPTGDFLAIAPIVWS